MFTVNEVALPPKMIEYSDYHEYMGDYYRFKKAQNRHFSFRRFSALAGIKSSNFLMLVMNRRRKLSPAMATAVARAMKLTKPESDYFTALVNIEHEKSPEGCEKFERERRIAIKKIIAKDVPTDKSEFLSCWYYALVRELAFLPDFAASAPWIAKKLGGLITEDQAEKSIRLLVNLGFWKSVDGKIQVADVFLGTGREDKQYAEIQLAGNHRQNLLAWAKILEGLPKQKRELGVINIPIDAEKIPELKKRIRRFQDEIVGWLQDEKNPTLLVQLGTYLVPVTTES